MPRNSNSRLSPVLQAPPWMKTISLLTFCCCFSAAGRYKSSPKLWFPKARFRRHLHSLKDSIFLLQGGDSNLWWIFWSLLCLLLALLLLKTRLINTSLAALGRIGSSLSTFCLLAPSKLWSRWFCWHTCWSRWFGRNTGNLFLTAAILLLLIKILQRGNLCYKVQQIILLF